MFRGENTSSIYTSLDKIESFVEKANNFHSTIKFTAEMSEIEITFLDRSV